MAACIMPKDIKFKKLSQAQYRNVNSEQSMSKKILALENILCLTDTEINKRKKIADEISLILRQYYPECEINIFGSSGNGFGFRGCDLDLLFLPFPDYCNLNFKGRRKISPPAPNEVFYGEYPLKELYSMNERGHLLFIKKILHAKHSHFKKIYFIPAKVPILNFEFADSAIVCDFSATNRFVVNNTQLLLFYGRFDQRVRPLVMFLRYWAKSLGFISKRNLSSYAFTLMVIFYLQNIQPCILPSVKWLIELSGQSCVINGWETAVCTDLEQTKTFTSENTSCIDELLLRFFDFYFDFDFITKIVSPHFGAAIPVKEMKEAEDLRLRTFKVTSISIQDPFILSQNVSRNPSLKSAFKLSLIIAKKLLLEKSFKFQLLFDSFYYQQRISAMSSPTQMNVSSNSLFIALQLKYELCSKLHITTKLKPWFEIACQTVLDILQYGLLAEIKVLQKTVCEDETIELPSSKIQAGFKNIEKFKLIMSTECVLPFQTLKNRRTVKLPQNFHDDVCEKVPSNLKREYKISKEMTKNETVSNPLKFMCKCFLYPFAAVPDVIIVFHPLTEDKTFRQIRTLLRSFVTKHARKIFSS